ncbi:MAG: aromatic ring-hydroxylating dioxygenase subunit alpha [Proteobacteria bacterium]|nr:aromatic ring-hydroxylating dioxygenase subunit alpha [Pseudomonadota bacterium]
MRHTEQVRLLKILMDHLDKGTNVDAGGIRRNPTEVYTCPELASREWETFFKGYPQVIGMSADLPVPGSFLTVSDFGIPVLAVRDDEGTFRAFLNVCRHRGTVVETEPRGERRKFSCPFHAWTYSNRGELVAVPKEDHFGKIDRSCHGLVPLPAEERYGFLWVHPDPDGAIDPDALLGGLAPEFETWNWGRLTYSGGDQYDMRLNWKLAMDTFGETYHFPVLHRNTLANFFYGNVQCYDIFGRNHRMILCLRDIDLLRNRPESEWHITAGSFPVYYLFPNIQVNVGESGVTLVRAYPAPGDPGRSISEISFYFDPDILAGSPQRAAERFQQFGNIIRDEDYAVAASAQRGAESGLLKYATFGRNEPALHHYHNTYRAALGMEPLPLIDT